MEIEDLAQQVARELLAALPELSAADQFERGKIVADAVRGSEGAGVALMSSFMDDSSFGDLRGGWIEQANGYGMQVQNHRVPSLLVDSIIMGRSAKSLIEEARVFASSPTTITDTYTAVAGATVAEVVSLGDDIELVPWAEVPDVHQKEVFGSTKPGIAFRSSLMIPSPMRAAANMAIRVSSADYRVLFSSNQEAHKVKEAATTDVTKDAERLRDIVRCITLQSERSVADLGSWAQLRNNFADNLFGHAYTFNGAMFEPAVYTASRGPSALAAKPIAHLFKCFEAFKDSESDPLRVSMDRFSQALRRPDVVDKAIELGIALEVMLLHSIAPTERGELRYRSAVRGAMFLGGDKDHRLNTFKVLRNAYDLRSKAVHAGTLTSKKNEPPPMGVLEKAISICARLVRKLIERGTFPDWDIEYVIGERWSHVEPPRGGQSRDTGFWKP